jgi:hypothetical protein
MNNSNKSKIEAELKSKTITKPAFVPAKNKIQLMEKEQEKSKIETEEFMQKHKSIMAHKLIENYDDEPKIVEAADDGNDENDKPDKNGHEDAIISIKNGKIHSDVPPKPLPRKSISEQGSFEDNSGVVIPKPRPRTSNLNYKVDQIVSHK